MIRITIVPIVLSGLLLAQTPKYEPLNLIKSDSFAYENEHEISIQTENPDEREKSFKYYIVIDDGCEAILEEDLQNWVYEMCAEYGISGYEKLIIAQLYCESSYRENLVSKTNDYGIAQINKTNHQRLKKELGITDFLDAKQSIRCGVYMMSECLKNNAYSENDALIAYNMGQSKVDSGIHETKYSRRVLTIKNDMEETNVLQR